MYINMQCMPLSRVYLPYQVKTQYLHFRFHANYFLLPWKIPEEKCSSMTKGSNYHINHMYIQPFTTIVDWPENWCLMEVYYVLYLQILRFYLGQQICDIIPPVGLRTESITGFLYFTIPWQECLHTSRCINTDCHICKGADFSKNRGWGGYPLKNWSVLTHLWTALSFVVIFLDFLFFPSFFIDFSPFWLFFFFLSFFCWKG